MRSPTSPSRLPWPSMMTTRLPPTTSSPLAVLAPVHRSVWCVSAPAAGSHGHAERSQSFDAEAVAAGHHRLQQRRLDRAGVMRGGSRSSDQLPDRRCGRCARHHLPPGPPRQRVEVSSAGAARLPRRCGARWALKLRSARALPASRCSCRTSMRWLSAAAFDGQLHRQRGCDRPCLGWALSSELAFDLVSLVRRWQRHAGEAGVHGDPTATWLKPRPSSSCGRRVVDAAVTICSRLPAPTPRGRASAGGVGALARTGRSKSSGHQLVGGRHRAAQVRHHLPHRVSGCGPSGPARRCPVPARRRWGRRLSLWCRLRRGR